MARLGHRLPNTVSKVRKPIVLGPAVVSPPVTVRLSYQLTRRTYAKQIVAHSKLFPPTVVGPAVSFPAASVRLADQLTRRRLPPQVVTRSRLRPPTVIQAPIVTGQIHSSSDVSSTIAPARAIAPAAINATSTVTGSFVARGFPSPAQSTITTKFATRRHSARSRLLPPTAVGPFVPPVAPPVEQTILHLTTVAVRTRGDYSRRTVQKTVRAPLYIQQPVIVPAGDQLKIRTKIPIQPRRLPARIALISPAIVNPIVLSREQTTVKTVLGVMQTRQRIRDAKVQSNLSAPVGTIRQIQTNTINATSTMGAATVVREQLIVPDPVMSTSTITGSVVRLQQVSGGVINATSDLLSVTLLGGSTVPSTTQPEVWAVHIHHHGR